MARDISGNYTLPLGNPVVEGTVIEAPWANSTMDDIATQLNGVITRDGKLGPSVAFCVLDGTSALPGLSFISGTGTGLWRATSTGGWSYNGTQHWVSSTGGVEFKVPPSYQADPATTHELTRKSYVDAAIAAAVTGTVAGTAAVKSASITSSRALTSADFEVGIVTIDSSSVVAITVPTIATLGLAATAGRVRTIAFLVAGTGIPTFAGATSSTSINGQAGTTTKLPIGGAPVQYQYVVLTQVSAGSNTWTLV